MSKLIGQGYDGCSAMAGMLNGVQAKIREIYPKALYVHCSAHCLNLVVNDLNSVQTIRNTTSTIKYIVAYFRESSRRKALVPNLPLLSETRWTSKCKSIRKFKENFSAILNARNELVNSSHSGTRQGAYQFLYCCKTTHFLFGLVTIAYYSSLLEPVTQKLQAVNLNLLDVQNHVGKILAICQMHRDNAEEYFEENIFREVLKLSEQLEIDLGMAAADKVRILQLISGNICTFPIWIQ